MMRRFGVAFGILLAAWTTAAQQQPASSQQPATSQPAAQQQPSAAQQQQQQQQEAQRRALEEQQRRQDEERAKQEEAIRQQLANTLNGLTPKPVSKTAPAQVTEPCLGLAMPRNQGFDLTEIPLAHWLAGTEHTDIPWRVEIKPPALRLDQRYELGYTSKIDSKNLKWSSGHHEIRYVSGVSTPDGRILGTPKSVKKDLDELPAGLFTVSLSDCVFLQPGKICALELSKTPQTEDTTSSRRTSGSPNARLKQCRE